MFRQMRVFAAALSSLFLLAGCGGGGGESEAEKEREAKAAASAGLPSCNAKATSATLPAAFPSTFPLPPDTVLTSVGQGGGGTFVRGVVPMGLKQTAEFFRREVPKAGFKPGEADAEPWEAESEFSGEGVEGKWKVNELPRCVEKAALLVAVSKQD
jgi:hypothetical protein